MRLFWAIAIVCVNLFGIAPGHAEKRVALVIGNSNYRNAGTLPNSVNDGTSMAELFTRAGFDVVESRSNVGIAEMRRIISNFANTARDSDIAIIYYAGHGIEVDGINYLIPVDATLARDDDVEYETISVDRVLRAIEPARRLRLVILDSCRNNPFADSMRRSTRAIGRGFARVEPTTRDTLVAFAAKAGSVAADGNGPHSPFTAALLQHLAVPGLDIRLALGNVRDTVMASTSPPQEPFVYGSLGGRTVALIDAPAAPPNSPPIAGAAAPGAARCSEAVEPWREVKETTSIAVLEAFIRRYNDCFYADLARLRVDELRKALAAVQPAAPVAPAGPATAVQPTVAAPVPPLTPTPDFQQIVERVKPAVISVEVKTKAGGGAPSGDMRGTPFEKFFSRFGTPDPKDTGNNAATGKGPKDTGNNGATGKGSGFFISADGYAVTTNHQVEGAAQVDITTDDGRRFSAKVVGADTRSDLALIKVDGQAALPFVRFSNRAPRVGERVLVIGHPFGLGNSVIAGIISALGRDIGAGPYDDFLQIDAAVSPGYSGGPAFDVEGNVIGVSAAIYTPSGAAAGSILFAIPVDTVNPVVTQLKEYGTITRGWIGVQIQPVTSEIAESLGLRDARGALVAEPTTGGPAQKAGIKAGDVIVSLDGAAVADPRALARRIASTAPGTSVVLGIFRGGSEETLRVTLGTLPAVAQGSEEPPKPTEPQAAPSRGERPNPSARVRSGLPAPVAKGRSR